MTYEALMFTFFGGALVALGFLALIFGFFWGLLSPKEKFELASIAFAFGVAALIVGAWLMKVF